MKTTLAKAMVLITIICMDLLTGMEFDLFVPSFPELQREFALTPFWVAGLLSINFIGYCLSLVLVGGLGDRYGRKPIIFIGLIIFVIGSVLCLVAPVYYGLLIGRFLQGVGVAAPSILSFLIIADFYSLKEQQFLMAMLNGLLNTAVAASPVLGSYITLYFHWQGNFTALLALGLITLVMTILFIPSYNPHQNKQLLTLSGYFEVFKSKPLMLLSLSLLFLLIPYWIFVGIAPLLYIKDLGVSLAQFGYYQGSLALVFAFGCLIYGLILKNTDYSQKKMLTVALIILTLSFIILSCVAYFNSQQPLFITLAFIPFIIAQVIPTTILYPLCLNFMPHAKAKISAIIQGGKLILSAIGLQIAAYFYQGNFQSVGTTVSICILIAIILLFLTIKNRELMQITKS